MILGNDGTVAIVDFNQSRADNPVQEIEKERLKFLHDLEHATDETVDEAAEEAA
jgi:NAD kinase